MTTPNLTSPESHNAEIIANAVKFTAALSLGGDEYATIEATSREEIDQLAEMLSTEHPTVKAKPVITAFDADGNQAVISSKPAKAPKAPKAPKAAKPAKEAKEEKAPKAAKETAAPAFDAAALLAEYHSSDVRDDAFILSLLQKAFDTGKAAPRARAPRAGGPTKASIAADLLRRPEGTTTKEILEVTGWPAVSVPAIARSAGLTLRQEKNGRVTTYYGS